jgi:quercetin dioxygenase-like cupin family protein
MSICVRPGEVPLTPGLQQKEAGGLNTTGLMDENLLAPSRGTDTVSKTAKKAGFVGTKRITMIRQHYAPGGTHLPHKHDLAEQTYYLESGNAQVRVGEDVYDLVPGSIVYIPPRVEHEFKNNSTEPCVNILISVIVDESDVATSSERRGFCVQPGDIELVPGIATKKDGTPNTTNLMDESLLHRRKENGTVRLGMIRQWYGVGGRHFAHQHSDNEQAYYLAKGNARVRVGDETFDMTAGTVVYLPPNIEHELLNPGPDTCANVLIGVQISKNDIA